ncbi:hypothetical protein ACFPJ1_40810 [Kribbella qitaiheensis]|uniref:hypothetical protein n=1 Tax=Kribbella qitaiheensis TaxID=1544730 RepID=UPI0036172B11
MSAMERPQDTLEHVATVTPLPSRATPDPAPAKPVINTAAIVDFVCPPDIWSDDRPSLRKVWLYGVYGRWTHADGFARFAGAAYATVIALPLHALAYTALWIVERPARLAVAAVLGTFIYLTLH